MQVAEMQYEKYHCRRILCTQSMPDRSQENAVSHAPAESIPFLTAMLNSVIQCYRLLEVRREKRHM